MRELINAGLETGWTFRRFFGVKYQVPNGFVVVETVDPFCVTKNKFSQPKIKRFYFRSPNCSVGKPQQHGQMKRIKLLG